MMKKRKQRSPATIRPHRSDDFGEGARDEHAGDEEDGGGLQHDRRHAQPYVRGRQEMAGIACCYDVEAAWRRPLSGTMKNITSLRGAGFRAHLAGGVVRRKGGRFDGTCHFSRQLSAGVIPECDESFALRRAGGRRGRRWWQAAAFTAAAGMVEDRPWWRLGGE